MFDSPAPSREVSLLGGFPPPTCVNLVTGAFCIVGGSAVSAIHLRDPYLICKHTGATVDVTA